MFHIRDAGHVGSSKWPIEFQEFPDSNCRWVRMVRFFFRVSAMSDGAFFVAIGALSDGPLFLLMFLFPSRENWRNDWCSFFSFVRRRQIVFCGRQLHCRRCFFGRSASTSPVFVLVFLFLRQHSHPWRSTRAASGVSACVFPCLGVYMMEHAGASPK